MSAAGRALARLRLSFGEALEDLRRELPHDAACVVIRPLRSLDWDAQAEVLGEREGLRSPRVDPAESLALRDELHPLQGLEMVTVEVQPQLLIGLPRA